MSRPTVEVADILHAQGDRFVEQNRSWLGIQRLSVLRAITRCRTAALGGHIDNCRQCGHRPSLITFQKPPASGISGGGCNHLYSKLFGAFEKKPDLLLSMPLFVILDALVDVL